MSNTHTLTVILTSAAVTILLRFLPFLIFGRGEKTPAFLTYLSKVLPSAIMAMLVVYCLRNVNPFRGSHGVPELIACAAVAGLHLWKKNTLLSIAAGTLLYMILVQIVFV